MYGFSCCFQQFSCFCLSGWFEISVFSGEFWSGIFAHFWPVFRIVFNQFAGRHFRQNSSNKLKNIYISIQMLQQRPYKPPRSLSGICRTLLKLADADYHEQGIGNAYRPLRRSRLSERLSKEISFQKCFKLLEKSFLWKSFNNVGKLSFSNSKRFSNSLQKFLFLLKQV